MKLLHGSIDLRRRREVLASFGAMAGLLALAPLVPRPAQATGTVESRLQQLGVTLPEVARPVANYAPYAVANGFAFIAGQIPMRDGELMHPGKIPTDVSPEQGQEAARQCAINIIAALKVACDGDLDQVRRCVRLQGFVASADDFTEQSQVVNGASDLIVDVFGEAGLHTRLAIGVNTLPLNACVEVSGIFALD